MEKVKDYLVVDKKTERVLYSGDNAFRAHQWYFAQSSTVYVKGKIQQAVINYITALSERLN